MLLSCESILKQCRGVCVCVCVCACVRVCGVCLKYIWLKSWEGHSPGVPSPLPLLQQEVGREGEETESTGSKRSKDQHLSVELLT